MYHTLFSTAWSDVWSTSEEILPSLYSQTASTLILRPAVLSAAKLKLWNSLVKFGCVPQLCVPHCVEHCVEDCVPHSVELCVEHCEDLYMEHCVVHCGALCGAPEKNVLLKHQSFPYYNLNLQLPLHW